MNGMPFVEDARAKVLLGSITNGLVSDVECNRCGIKCAEQYALAQYQLMKHAAPKEYRLADTDGIYVVLCLSCLLVYAGEIAIASLCDRYGLKFVSERSPREKKKLRNV
jgi:hypothetical protein